MPISRSTMVAKELFVFHREDVLARSDQDKQLAARYLAENSELRQALGISSNAQLVPEYLGEGEHNRNFWFTDPSNGTRFVLRINVEPQPFHDDQVAYEFAALKLLEPCGRTPKPLYLDNSPEAPGKGALVESFCAGRQLNFDSLQPHDIQCAVKLMADIHAVPLDETSGASLFRPADPLRGLFDECVRRFKRYRASSCEDVRLTRWTELFLEKAQRALEAPCQPSECQHIVNTETLAAHFLLPENLQVTSMGPIDNPGYFIDWERPIIGEVAQDVAYFVAPTTTFWDSGFFFTVDQTVEVVERYWQAVDGRFSRGGFDARYRAFLMMTILRSTTWLCKALPIYLGKAPGHMTERTRKKFPQYLADDFMEMLAKDYFGL